jgi:hypothetical protein
MGLTLTGATTRYAGSNANSALVPGCNRAGRVNYLGDNGHLRAWTTMDVAAPGRAFRAADWIRQGSMTVAVGCPDEGRVRMVIQLPHCFRPCPGTRLQDLSYP